MKLFCAVFIWMVTGVTNSSGQNLVPNPGFEMQDSCPAVSEIWLAPPWNSPTLGTPDLMNDTCSTQNYAGRTGIGSSGIFTYNTFPNNREYIQAPLTSPLVTGQVYSVSFWVKYISYRYAVNRMGAYFSVGMVNQTTTSNLSYTPQIDNPGSNMLSSTGWMQISGSFVASGGESYILIGNFYSDSQTTTAIVNSASSSNVSYYQVDDISVTASGLGINDHDALSEAIHVYPLPATDVIHVRLPAALNIHSVKLLNDIGRSVDATIHGIPGEEMEVTIGNCTSGVYFLSFETENTVIQKRIVITK